MVDRSAYIESAKTKYVTLHCSFVDEAYAYGSALFGEGTGPVLLGNVHCNGDEENIGDCQAREGDFVHCNHNQDAGVSCGVICTLIF